MSAIIIFVNIFIFILLCPDGLAHSEDYFGREHIEEPEFGEPFLMENVEPVVKKQGSVANIFDGNAETMRSLINKYNQHRQQTHKEVPATDASTMSDVEVLFHYFQTLDLDKDSKVDGTELAKSILRQQHYGNEVLISANVSSFDFTDEELEQIIDPILTRDDINRDGMIDYFEFRHSQMKRQLERRAIMGQSV